MSQRCHFATRSQNARSTPTTMRFDAALTFPIIDSTLGSRGADFRRIKRFPRHRRIWMFGNEFFSGPRFRSPRLSIPSTSRLSLTSSARWSGGFQRDAQPQDDEFLQERQRRLPPLPGRLPGGGRRSGNNPQLLKEVQEQFRARISPYFDRAGSGHRARTKPRNYPGTTRR